MKSYLTSRLNCACRAHRFEKIYEVNQVNREHSDKGRVKRKNLHFRAGCVDFCNIISVQQRDIFSTKMVLPSVRIYEEPERRKRFRYATEGRSTPLQGVTSTPTARTPPSIEVANYDGLVTIAVSCVTAGEYPR